MASKNTAQVVIGGKVITLGGYESPDYLQKVANYMNGKLEEFKELPGYSRQPMETKHMLLSLNISDDYFKAKNQAENLEQELGERYQQMYELKHELVSLKMKIEELEQETDKLRKKLERP